MPRLLVLVTALTTATPAPPSPSPISSTLRADGSASGVSPTVYELSTAGLTPDPTIKTLVETQPEFTTPIWDYLDQRVTDSRIAWQAASRKPRSVRRDGQAFRRRPYVLASIWGIETDYGAVLGNNKLIKPIVRSLATLVYQQRGR